MLQLLIKAFILIKFFLFIVVSGHHINKNAYNMPSKLTLMKNMSNRDTIVPSPGGKLLRRW